MNLVSTVYAWLYSNATIHKISYEYEEQQISAYISERTENQLELRNAIVHHNAHRWDETLQTPYRTHERESKMR